MRISLRCFAVLFAGVISVVALVRLEAAGQTSFYQWVDEKGTVHVTDSLGRVPEQYRSQATKIEAAKPQQEPDVQQQPAPKAQGSDLSTNGRAEWQQRIREWKQRLADAENQYRALQQQRNDLFAAWGSPAMAPLANRQQAEQIDRQMQEVQQEIVRAKNMIDNVIPEEARKAGVPPGWLRE